jgi:arylsulfatase
VADRGRDEEGVLVCWGRRAAGFSLFVQGDRLIFDFNLAGDHTVVTSPRALPVGDVTFELRVDRDGERATATLCASGELLVQAPLPQLVPRGMGTLSTQCGANSPSAVSELYRSPFRYSGALREVLIDLGDADAPNDADWRAALAQQ